MEQYILKGGEKMRGNQRMWSDCKANNCLELQKQFSICHLGMLPPHTHTSNINSLFLKVFSYYYTETFILYTFKRWR